MVEGGGIQLLKSWWEGFNFSGSFTFILVAKLRALKFILKKWNKEVFRQTAVGKAMALDQVVFWDTNERSCNLSHEEVEAREVVREEFKKLVMLKEISWR